MSHFLIQLLSFLVRYYIWIAICAVSMLYRTLLLLDLPFSGCLVLTVFSSTVVGYYGWQMFGLYRIAAAAKQDKQVVKLPNHLLYHVVWFGLNVVIVVICFLFCLSAWAQFCLLFSGCLVALYVVPVIKSKNLRQITGLKILIIAMVWVLATVVLPVAQIGAPDWANYTGVLGWILAERFVFLILLCLPFDWRDVAVDQKANIKTWPRLLGLEKTKYLFFTLVSLQCVLNIVIYYLFLQQINLVLITIILPILLIFLATKAFKYPQNSILFIFLDGMMVVQTLLLIVVGKYL